VPGSAGQQSLLLCSVDAANTSAFDREFAQIASGGFAH